MMVNLILCAVIVIQAIFHFIERRDMSDRLMSKDLTEYKRADFSSDKHTSRIPSAHERALKKWRSTSKAGEE
jgi:hypothetical protein